MWMSLMLTQCDLQQDDNADLSASEAIEQVYRVILC